MSNYNPGKLDQKYLWHPFTQMKDWLKNDPIVLEKGKGSILYDNNGRKFIDANSSIWTNLHGHNHPKINRAIREQLNKVSHVSALGFSNIPAAKLGQQLIRIANPKNLFKTAQRRLAKVFFSDDGSTAVEVAIKLAYEFAKRTGKSSKPRFLSLNKAYHGDTIGAVSAGHIDLFHKAYSGLLFKTDKVIAPYCYRCPFNKAKPERADAREYRKCNMECTQQVEQKFKEQKKKGNDYAAFLIEPRIQGPAGMIAQPKGWLSDVTSIAREHGTQIIADEVMTGFGRASDQQKFASHTEKIQPDYLCLAKGLSGGYLPMAATITTQEVFDVFLGDYSEFKTFFHGHSFTGNPLGAAASLASIDILNSNNQKRIQLARHIKDYSKILWKLDAVGDMRQSGCVLGVELVRNWKNRKPYDLSEQAGIRICSELAKKGILTRPIGNVIVIMPPFSTTKKQVNQIFSALYESIEKTL